MLPLPAAERGGKIRHLCVLITFFIASREPAFVRVCVLISGRGSNAEALIRGADTYSVVSVISNKHDAPGLGMATSLGVECMVEPSIDRIGDMLEEIKPDLVCMAGFMRILPARRC